METLLYFLLWGALIFFMMRFGCGAHVMGHGHGRGHKQDKTESSGGDAQRTVPEKDLDPVCGMTVATATSKSSVHDGRPYYFCSAGCRDKFETQPATYVKAIAKPMEKKEQSHEHQH